MGRLIVYILLSLSFVGFAGMDFSMQNSSIRIDNFVDGKYYFEIEDSCVSDTIVVISVISITDSISRQINIEHVNLLCHDSLGNKRLINSFNALTDTTLYDINQRYFFEKYRVYQLFGNIDVSELISSGKIWFNKQQQRYIIYLSYKIIPLNKL